MVASMSDLWNRPNAPKPDHARFRKELEAAADAIEARGFKNATDFKTIKPKPKKLFKQLFFKNVSGLRNSTEYNLSEDCQVMKEYIEELWKENKKLKKELGTANSAISMLLFIVDSFPKRK